MRILILILLSCSLTACATATISTKHTDGKQTECTGTYYSLFKDMNSLNMSVCGSKSQAAGSSVNTALAGDLLKVLLTP
ncbi:hypothetical protein UFOVP1419_30 [uncultured Caudovirales phage]|uniref:Lipoprotein n=1 Tax=uncultured Caudovirales phage TaxID=2100421 RepID=A0A6J5SDB4_9CAUD|nr:hypothetical protein UFOVP1419_30 [uncultured Caudovirales phage]